MLWCEHSPLCWEPFPRSSLPIALSAVCSIFPSILHKVGNEGLEKELMFNECMKKHSLHSHHWATCREDLAPPHRNVALVGCLSHNDTRP